MIWVICELNGKGYQFTTCGSMEEAEYLNFELWSFRNQFGKYNIDEFETFLRINAYKSYDIRNGKISSFGNIDGSFTTFLFSQKKFNYFADSYIKKMNKQQIVVLQEYADEYEKINILFDNETLIVTKGKIVGKRFNMYCSKINSREKLPDIINNIERKALISKAIHFNN